MSRGLLVVAAAAAAGAAGCKARQDGEGAALRSQDDGAARSQLGSDWLQRLEADTNLLSGELLAGMPRAAGDDGPLGGGDAYALQGTVPTTREELERIATALDAMSREQVGADVAKARVLVIELQALSQLVDTLSPDELRRLETIVKRIKGFIAEGPIINNDAEMYCKDIGNGSWLPALRNGDQVRGVAGQAGKGFTQKQNCENAIAGKKNGLVCSLDGNGHVTATYLKDNTQVRKTGFAQTANCIRAVADSDAARDLLCHVDNSETRESSYIRFSIKTGKFTDYWYYDLDRCMAGRKGLPASRKKQLALAECDTRSERCMRLARLESTELRQMSAETDCRLEKIKCMQDTWNLQDD